jgi:hypothetical protein
MTKTTPKGMKCAGCNLPIKITELFVAYRLGEGVRFWHNRTRVTEDCWGKFLLERVHYIHAVYDLQTTKRSHRLSSGAPASP